MCSQSDPSAFTAICKKGNVNGTKRCFSNIAAAQAQVDANSKRAARLRQSILKQAFKGKLVPQDPTDEPAEQLLDRIRQEQESSNMQTGRNASARRTRGKVKESSQRKE